MKSKSKFTKKQQNIISITAFIIVVLIIAVIVAIINYGSKKSSESPTDTPSATEEATVSPTPTTAASDSVSSTASAEDTDSSDTDANNDSSQSNTKSNITDSSSLSKAQSQFDQYISDKNYSAALDMIKNSFSNSSVAEAVVNTYQNYVSYYESQGKYSESLSYQLDYIEKHDGLDNVVPDSVHYKLLQNTLKNISSNDSRIQKIQASADRWNSINELFKQKSYSEAEQKLLKMKEEGLDCVIYYSYLGKVYKQQQKYKEALDLYFTFIDSRTDYNTLEKDYVLLFENNAGAMYYQGMLTDEDIAPYKDRIKITDQSTDQ